MNVLGSGERQEKAPPSKPDAQAKPGMSSILRWRVLKLRSWGISAPTGRCDANPGPRPRCSTHLFELPARGWAEGVPAAGHVVQALESFPDRFDAGPRVDRAVYEAAQWADHPHHLSQGRRGWRRQLLLRDWGHRLPFRDCEHGLATQVGKLATPPPHKPHRSPRVRHPPPQADSHSAAAPSRPAPPATARRVERHPNPRSAFRQPPTPESCGSLLGTNSETLQPSRILATQRKPAKMCGTTRATPWAGGGP